jgi:hypothetical protein
MKYKLLKFIELKENFISVWDTLDSIWGFVNLDSWLQLSVELLIEQGFIEEVKETIKPKWKVGDYVVHNHFIWGIQYMKIFSVTQDLGLFYINNSFKESELRDPTREELSIYFR